MEKVTIRTTKSVTGHCKEVNDTVVVMTIIKRRYVGTNENTEHKLSFWPPHLENKSLSSR